MTFNKINISDDDNGLKKFKSFVVNKWIPEVLLRLHAYPESKTTINYQPLFFVNIPLKPQSQKIKRTYDISNTYQPNEKIDFIRTVIELPKYIIKDGNRIQVRPIDMSISFNDNKEQIEKVECLNNFIINTLGSIIVGYMKDGRFVTLDDIDYDNWVECESMTAKIRKAILNQNF